jgi:hypothetical protein
MRKGVILKPSLPPHGSLPPTSHKPGWSTSAVRVLTPSQRRARRTYVCCEAVDPHSPGVLPVPDSAPFFPPRRRDRHLRVAPRHAEEQDHDDRWRHGHHDVSAAVPNGARSLSLASPPPSHLCPGVCSQPTTPRRPARPSAAASAAPYGPRGPLQQARPPGAPRCTGLVKRCTLHSGRALAYSPPDPPSPSPSHPTPLNAPAARSTSRRRRTTAASASRTGTATSAGTTTSSP